ncbi:MAG: histidinol-phosphatase HisJ family protein, partial [Spartobacteria bacterium]|nr:histidinol-phosphatase HisJ family protein [Spartobacteria bacterium]
PANFTFLFGIEADYYPGCETYLRRWLYEQPFDIVLGSVHYLDFWAMESYDTNPLWYADEAEVIWRTYYKLIGELADSRMYDVVTHIDLPKKFGRRPSDHIIRETVCPALDRIAAAGMGIEINTSGLHHPINETYPSEQILRWAFEREIPITFASDAHQPEHIASDFPAALALAKRIGYTHSLRLKNRQKTIEPLP